MKSRNIVIVDPDHDSRVELRRILEEKGHYVLSVTRGKDLINLLDTIQVPDFIFLSDVLLFMNPQDLVDIIRKRSDYDEALIIQITSADTEKLSGAAYLLPRRFTPEEINSCLAVCKKP